MRIHAPPAMVLSRSNTHLVPVPSNTPNRLNPQVWPSMLALFNLPGGGGASSCQPPSSIPPASNPPSRVLHCQAPPSILLSSDPHAAVLSRQNAHFNHPASNPPGRILYPRAPLSIPAPSHSPSRELHHQAPPATLAASDPTLPFTIEHNILKTVQKLLEEALFEFAEKYIPALLQHTRWDTPEAGELTKWNKAIAKFSQPHSLTNHHLGTLIRNTHRIRHAAVHRNPTNVHELRKMLKDSYKLAEALLDKVRCGRLQLIQLSLDAINPNSPDYKDLEAALSTPLPSVKTNVDVGRHSFVNQDEIENSYSKVAHQKLFQLGRAKYEAAMNGPEAMQSIERDNKLQSLNWLNQPRSGEDVVSGSAENIRPGSNKKRKRVPPRSRVIRYPNIVIDLTSDSDGNEVEQVLKIYD